jgi:WD40 repeat protein
MFSPPILAPGSLAAMHCALAAVLASLPTNSGLNRPSQSAAQHQKVHSVIFQTKLTPPLRSPEVSLRYSPDGNYLVLQDPTGVIVLQTNPLRMLIHISTENVYPVEFSSDSQSLVLVARGLSYAKWRLPDGERIASGDLPSREDCADGRISPGGEFFACLQPDLHFVLFDLSSGKSIFEESVAPAPPAGPGLRFSHPVNVFYFASLDVESAFPGPFGLIRTNEPRPDANRLLYNSSIHFSPDAKMLLARSQKNFFAVDIVARKSFEPPGAIQKLMAGAVALQTSDRIIAVENAKGYPGEQATILSLKNAEALGNLSFSARRLEMATNPRFVLPYNVSPDGPSAAAFDLDQSRPLETPPAVALDIHGDELAVSTQNGSIALYRIGERNLLANLPLPLPSLPPLRSASVTPNADKLAISVDGVGAVFDVAAGQRVTTLAKFSAVNFLGPNGAWLLFPGFYEDLAHISLVDVSKGTVSPSWEVGKEEQLRSGGFVLLHYSPLQGMSIGPGDIPEPGMAPPYTLRARDPATGKELWNREFKDNPPTPFADPQGERLVLGWKAKSSEAKSGASRNPATREILKNSKLTDRDSFFEVLDARSGNSVGGVLVMAGSGAASFDAAFSAGNTLILEKDGSRVSLYSLRDGQLKARLVGFRPSVSKESNLLALDLGEGRLGIFDLSTGTKLDEQIFPEALAYTHFSAEGKRLFVLTEHQSAVILDVSNVRSAPAPVPQTPENKN